VLIEIVKYIKEFKFKGKAIASYEKPVNCNRYEGGYVTDEV
jgi:hypothetical protein